LRRLKEALNITDFEDSGAIGLPDGRQEHGLRDMFEQFEEARGDVQGVLAFLSCFLKEMMESGIHLIHEVIDSLCFKLGGHPQ